MENKIDIIFIDDFAMSLDIDEKIDKNEIMHIINNERSDSEKRNSKKYYNKGTVKSFFLLLLELELSLCFVRNKWAKSNHWN